jgi:uncharacterized protein YndB with AHSA1/START domain
MNSGATTASTTDRIEKRILLRAPIDRVWRAISDASQFGTWFGVAFDGPFVAGARMKARIVPTKVDAEVAASQKQYEGMPFEVAVEGIEPMHLFSFRWHPFAVEPGVAYDSEPTTLVAFVLEEVPGGTQLTITESGFDRIPLERRAKAFSANEHGWEAQTRLIGKFLAFP